MSEPAKTNKLHYWDDFMGTIMDELISASSSLNMFPDPIENVNPDLQGYLSETDYNAKHSMEHIRAAFDAARRLRVKLSALAHVLHVSGLDIYQKGGDENEKAK